MKKVRYILEEFEINFENSYSCNCVDRDGYPKILYSTFNDAQKAKANKSWLKIYPCPEKMGFHLSGK
jgi:hypothetical protein